MTVSVVPATAPHPRAARVAGALRVVQVTSEAELRARADDWWALLARSAVNRLSQTPFWLLTWWQVFGGSDHRRLAVALVYDGNQLVGIAPMLRRLLWYRRMIPYRRVEFVATGEKVRDEIRSDYLGVIAERGYEEAVIDALASAWVQGSLGSFDEIVLSALDGDLPIWQYTARALSERGLLVEKQSLPSAPFIRLPNTWEGYLASLSGTNRYFVNRSIRDFEKWAGSEVTIERVRSPADLVKGKQVLMSLHEERWTAAGQHGVFASPLFSAFHGAMQSALLERGALELVWLVVRGEPLAVLYNMLWDNKTMSYQGGRTLDVPKGVRPGIILHLRMIRAAIEAGRTEYDFLSGMSQYKAKLSNASRPILRLRASQAPLRDLACKAVERGADFVREQRSRFGGEGAAASAPPTDREGDAG